MIYEVSGYRVDLGQRVLFRGDDVVRVTPKVFDTLAVLVERAGQVVSKDELMRLVWPSTHVGEANLAQNISKLRALLPDVAIATLPKRGYRLAATVRRLDLPAAAIPGPPQQAQLRGRHHLDRLTAGDLERAIAQFERAIALDPEFAAAHAGLAETLIVGSYHSLDPRTALPRARVAAARAVALDPADAAAHRALGMIAMLHDWNWSDAEASLRRALALRPLDADTHRVLGLLLTLLERFDEGLALSSRAVELDPASLPANAYLALAYNHAGRFEEALAAAEAALELDPDFPPALAFRGFAQAARGDVDAAIVSLERAVTLLRQPLSLAELGHLYARAGRRDDARAILRELQQRAATTRVAGEALAMIQLPLGDVDDAFASLELAFRQRSSLLPPLLRVHPWTLPWRGDPRWQSLRQRVFAR